MKELEESMVSSSTKLKQFMFELMYALIPRPIGLSDYVIDYFASCSHDALTTDSIPLQDSSTSTAN